MTLEADIARIAIQEERLRFGSFDEATAWRLGQAIREIAEARATPVVIDIRVGPRTLFHYAMAGTSADNADWARRKANLTLRMGRSTYGFGRALLKKGQTLGPEIGLDPREHAAHGGSFPIHVRGTGAIGAVTVSGPPQRQDHALVVAGLCAVLGLEESALALGPETD